MKKQRENMEHVRLLCWRAPTTTPQLLKLLQILVLTGRPVLRCKESKFSEGKLAAAADSGSSAHPSKRSPLSLLSFLSSTLLDATGSCSTSVSTVSPLLNTAPYFSSTLLGSTGSCSTLHPSKGSPLSLLSLSSPQHCSTALSSTVNLYWVSLHYTSLR